MSGRMLNAFPSWNHNRLSQTQELHWLYIHVKILIIAPLNIYTVIMTTGKRRKTKRKAAYSALSAKI